MATLKPQTRGPRSALTSTEARETIRGTSISSWEKPTATLGGMAAPFGLPPIHSRMSPGPG